MVRTCPDCGGILEPTRPDWMAAIALVDAATAAAQEPLPWRCLICGYHEPADASADHDAAAPATP